MRHGVSIPCFGTGVDAALVADWAVAAESAGWDGFFPWDHLFAFAPGPVDVVDPWIALTAAACATQRIRLGTLVTPAPPAPPGRGEHLELLERLWTGEPVHHEGRHYRVAGPDWSAVCYPPPLQQPRIPIWAGGTWPGTGPSTGPPGGTAWCRCAWTAIGRSPTPRRSRPGWSRCAPTRQMARTRPMTSPFRARPRAVTPAASSVRRASRRRSNLVGRSGASLALWLGGGPSLEVGMRERIEAGP